MFSVRRYIKFIGTNNPPRSNPMSFYTLFAKLQRLAYMTNDDDLLNSIVRDLEDGDELEALGTEIGDLAAQIQLEYDDAEVDDVIDFLDDRAREIEVAREDAKCIAEIEAIEAAEALSTY